MFNKKEGESKTMRVNVFVNGYGAPENPAKDGNLTRYLGAVKAYIESHSNDQFIIRFAGGYTNRQDMSEAWAMYRWFHDNGAFPTNIKNVDLIEDSTTGRDNLRLFSEEVSHDIPSVFFFECSRKPHVVFFAKKFFPRSPKELLTFIGVPFDTKSMALTNRVKEYLFKYPLLVLSWYFPFIDKYVVKPIRGRHVAKCRKEVEMKQ